MKKMLSLVAVVSFVVASGCASREGSAVGGALGGAAVGAGAYEYSSHRQMQDLESDYKAGRIDKREYEIRRDQIRRGSVLK